MLVTSIYQHFLLFLVFSSKSFKQHLICCLQMHPIWSHQKFCHWLRVKLNERNVLRILPGTAMCISVFLHKHMPVLGKIFRLHTNSINLSGRYLGLNLQISSLSCCSKNCPKISTGYSYVHI